MPRVYHVEGGYERRRQNILNMSLKGVKFDRLVLRKIDETLVTRYQMLRLKCTKFDYRKGFAPDSTREA